LQLLICGLKIVQPPAVSKLFNPLNRIPHNRTNLENRCCFKHTWCNKSRALLVAPGVLDLEHMKYLNWQGLLS